ncbi:MAG: Flp pilus assembly complex ATPase component TadA [Deltaproteobacteria bacterium]|nr:Flp pilus assembly complex ATPase component TadA [Deltaproteobacteria bacterium]
MPKGVFTAEDKKNISVTGTVLAKYADDLVAKGMVTQDQLTLARASVDNLGIDLGQILITRGFVKENELLNFLAEKLNCPFHEPQSEEIDSEILRVFPFHLAKKSFVLPLKRQANNKILVAMASPNDPSVNEELRGYYPEGFDKVLSPPLKIIELLEKHHTQSTGLESDSTVVEVSSTDADDVENMMETKKIQEIASGPKIIATVNSMISKAKKEGASDIHIEPYRDNCRLRYRIDGILKEKGNLPKSMHLPVVSRIKIMAQLDIAEKRVPQDGKARVRLVGKPLDMRINTCPTQFGEKVVIRLFAKDNVKTIESLGFLERERRLFTDIISKPNGIFLVTGPTGSGKSSTLYAGLMRINTPEINIMTIEDPVESELEGVNQIAVSEKTGLTFEKVLRAALRQDPDVIMLGEIRDGITAEIAVRAAITGHMVLSTLHTNTAAGAIDRLKDIGVEPFMLASSLRGVLAQRLVRNICTHCREETSTDNIYNVPLKKNYVSKGCDKCSFSGLSGGRLGIFELINIDAEIRDLIHNNAGESEITRHLRAKKIPSIMDDGLAKVEMGITSLEEVMRVTAEN